MDFLSLPTAADINLLLSTSGRFRVEAATFSRMQTFQTAVREPKTSGEIQVGETEMAQQTWYQEAPLLPPLSKQLGRSCNVEYGRICQVALQEWAVATSAHAFIGSRKCSLHVLFYTTCRVAALSNCQATRPATRQLFPMCQAVHIFTQHARASNSRLCRSRRLRLTSLDCPYGGGETFEAQDNGAGFICHAFG